jgi:hypothetical protein
MAMLACKLRAGVQAGDGVDALIKGFRDIGFQDLVPELMSAYRSAQDAARMMRINTGNLRLVARTADGDMKKQLSKSATLADARYKSCLSLANPAFTIELSRGRRMFVCMVPVTGVRNANYITWADHLLVSLVTPQAGSRLALSEHLVKLPAHGSVNIDSLTPVVDAIHDLAS